MELLLWDGDYIPDQAGGFKRVDGQEALLQRVIFRLAARRGKFPFWETLGSRLWELGRLPVVERPAAARQYVIEALEEEPVRVERVTLTELGDGRALVNVSLSGGDGTFSASVAV